MFSQKETRTLALLAALTPLAPASAAGNPLNDAGKETAFRGISLDLASSYLPSQETQLSLLAPATQDALALGGDRALPLARLEGFSDSPFTALADTSAIAAVPEPSAWSMLTLGVAGTLVAAIRRRLFS